MKPAKPIIAAIFVTAIAHQADSAPTCARVSGTMRSQIQSQLSMRAIDIMTLAKSPNWAGSLELVRLVNASVSVKGEAGDVGVALPPGLSAIHILAQGIHATDYRYEGWTYMDGPFDACIRQNISVEFFDKQSGRSWPVKFEFENGRLEAVETWERSIVSVPLPSLGRLDQKGS